MDNKQITIRMPKPLLDSWLAALRSGEYPQTRGAMRDKVGYCCLGVLVAVVAPDSDELNRGTPSNQFLLLRGIKFGVTDPSGIAADEGNPYLPGLSTWAAPANDDGKSFAELADAIEACAEGF